LGVGSGLADHVDEGGTGFLRGPDFTGEVDAGALDAVGGDEAEGKAEAVDGGHGSGGGFEGRMGVGEEDHRVDVVGVYMGEDAGGRRGERVGGGGGVDLCRDPAHDAEAADIVEVAGLDAEEGEVLEVDPVATVLVTVEVELAGGGEVGCGDGCGEADEGGASGA